MATIKDVANDAGVAVGTVSKVLNGHHVSAENKRKVEESVARLGYQMNYYARGLKTRYGYRMFLCQSLREAKKDAYYLQLACQNKVDGILGITFNTTELSQAGDTPVVMIDRHLANSVCVTSDNFHGGSWQCRS